MFCKRDPAAPAASRTWSRGARRRALALVPVVGLAAASLGAEPPDPAVLLERVQRWLDGTRDLQGRFEQSLVSGALGTGLTESGRFFLQRPGRMRWDYLAPEKKVALVRGERTWFYVEEDEQLLRGRIDGSELLLRLLAGDRPLAQLFEVVPRDASEDAGDTTSHRLELIPREGDLESFQAVVLRLGGEDGSIGGAEVVDVAGNRVAYRFLELRRNAGLRPEIFSFEPPEGTVILGEH